MAKTSGYGSSDHGGSVIYARAKRRHQSGVSIVPIIPTVRREPFDSPDWSFELKGRHRSFFAFSLHSI